ncbi:MAG TPA: hypothetical protein VGO08_18875 [Burkholderiales bacterium]|jgi:hypothetical protein|nr:hypothetical protein [Burkholderiales bacterium]
MSPASHACGYLIQPEIRVLDATVAIIVTLAATLLTEVSNTPLEQR